MLRPHPRLSATVLSTVALAAAVLCSGCSSSSSGATPTSPHSATPTVANSSTVVPSQGCTNHPTTRLTNQQENVSVKGASRWYLLTTPAPTTPITTAAASRKAVPTTTGVAGPRPLVLDFHGLAEGAVVHSTTSQFGALGQKDGFVVAFPNGTGSPVQWDTTDHSPTNPDLMFVSALLAQVESSQCIDTSRVYASGFSDGSFMVSLLACTMSDRFAAIAAVSGLQLNPPCPTSRRVPIITFHGTADPILFFNGGVGTATLKQILGSGGSAEPSTTSTTRPVLLNGPGYPATVREWATKNGCAGRPANVNVASKVILRSYPCPEGTAVEFYIVIGGGHAWPGSTFSESIRSITGFTTFAINATGLIWNFFQRFRL